MGKNLFDLRFAVRRADGYTSLPWRLWITSQGDVYLASRSMAAVEKYSFHWSGICRHAFTKEHGPGRTMQDRVLQKWKRVETPMEGAGQASRVAWMAFPTDYLSRLVIKDAGKIHWIAAAPPGGAAYVDLAFTAESEGSVRAALGSSEKTLVSYTALSPEEAFIIFTYHSDWENKDISSPTKPGSIFPDLLFSPNDPGDTGRPVRACIQSHPSDGDAVHIQEIGGYRV